MCPSRGRGCGGQQPPKWRSIVCEGETAPCQCEEGEPMDGSDQTIMLQNAVPFF